MKTDSKDLLYKHFDLFSAVMDASKDSTDFVVCPSCAFQLTHKSHTLSVESAINKVIAHMLENHNQDAKKSSNLSAKSFRGIGEW